MTLKTTPPSSSGAIRREALWYELRRVLPGHAVWCTAPAGSGKTLGAAGFVHDEGTPYLWLSLDEADDDPATLFHYLALGATALYPTPPDLPRFGPDRLSALPAYARYFFRALYATNRPDWWLILDNYHFLPERSPVHEVLRIAVEELPDNGRILVTSRQPPPAVYAALQLTGRLHVLDPRVVFLSPEESVAIGRARGHGLPKSAALEAHRLASGWTAGVVLILDHLASGGKMEGAATLGSHPLLFDYFFTEVWRELPPPTQSFLIRIACLPHLSAPAARTLGARPEAGEILEDLAHRQQFVIRSQGEGESEPCYELHALFRAFLLDQVERTMSPNERRAFLLEAAAWYRDHGRPNDAASLFSEADAWGELHSLVLRHASALLAAGRARTLLAWIELLPEEIQQSPWVIYWRAMALLFLDPERSLNFFMDAADRFRQGGEIDGDALASAGVMDAILFGMLGARALDPWLERLEGLLEAEPSFQVPEARARVQATFFRSLMIHRPQHPRIGEYANELLHCVAGVSDPNLRILAELDVAFHHMFRGDLQSAFAVLEQADAECRSRPAGPMTLVTLRRARAWYALLTQDQTLGRKVIDEGLNLGREHGVPVWDAQFHSTALALALCAGDRDAAQTHVEALEALPEPAKKVNLAYNHCTFAWYALELQRPQQAARHVELARQGATEHGLLFCRHWANWPRPRSMPPMEN